MSQLGNVKIVARSRLLESRNANKNNKQTNQLQVKTRKRGKFECGSGRGLREETERP